MPHQDSKSPQIIVNHRVLKQAIDKLLEAKAFRRIGIRDGSKWTAWTLVVMALLWAWSGAPTLVERFGEALAVVGKIFRWRKRLGKSYQGFLKQLRKWHAELLLVCSDQLRMQMRQDPFGRWEFAGFVLMAGDGSRVELPRTVSNEEKYSARGKGKGKRPGGKRKSSRGKARRRRRKQSAKERSKKAVCPQIYLTLMWHIGTGLPWCWRTGAVGTDESKQVLGMLEELPENALIVADAHYVGYDFLRAVVDSGREFVIRGGANVRLLRGLGYAREYDGIVYLWPKKVMRRGHRPLVLRVVWVHDGKEQMCLMTSVLSRSRLSDKQVAQIYRARWGIEVFFRTFKQTFGRRKLRSGAAENALVELDWSLVGLWAVCLLGQQELMSRGRDPCRLSAAGAIKAIQGAMRQYRNRPESLEEVLWWKLSKALLDEYERKSSKASRDYPRRKQKRQIGVPKILEATLVHQQAAKELRSKTRTLRLTA